MDNKTVTCRPCKEQGNWEIQDQFGKVQNKHYASKDACVKAGRKLANESACELVIEDQTEGSK